MWDISNTTKEPLGDAIRRKQRELKILIDEMLRGGNAKVMPEQVTESYKAPPGLLDEQRAGSVAGRKGRGAVMRRD